MEYILKVSWLPGQIGQGMELYNILEEEEEQFLKQYMQEAIVRLGIPRKRVISNVEASLMALHLVITLKENVEINGVGMFQWYGEKPDNKTDSGFRVCHVLYTPTPEAIDIIRELGLPGSSPGAEEEHPLVLQFFQEKPMN